MNLRIFNTRVKKKQTNEANEQLRMKHSKLCTPTKWIKVNKTHWQSSAKIEITIIMKLIISKNEKKNEYLYFTSNSSLPHERCDSLHALKPKTW